MIIADECLNGYITKVLRNNGLEVFANAQISSGLSDREIINLSIEKKKIIVRIKISVICVLKKD